MDVTGQLRRRYRAETVLASLSALLFVVTAALPEWIEATTGLEPDAGSGAAEFAIAAALLVVAVVATCLALVDRRRLALSQR